MSSSHLPLGCVKQGNWWPWLTRSLCRRFLDQNWIVKLFCTVHQGHIHFVILWSSFYYTKRLKFFPLLALFYSFKAIFGYFWLSESYKIFDTLIENEGFWLKYIMEKICKPMEKFANRTFWYPPNQHRLRKFLPDPPSIKLILNSLLHQTSI